MENPTTIDVVNTNKYFQVKNYGTEKFGELKKVLLHTPVTSIKLINDKNYKFYLFNKVPKLHEYIKEHYRYCDLLKSLGIEVYKLEDYVFENVKLMNSLPNLAYLHDSSAITSKGAILSKMCPGGRENEEKVVKEALMNLGIPIFHEYEKDQCSEGCLLLSLKTILLANTERHTKESIFSFVPKALEIFDEVVYVKVPNLRRFMHPDMIFNRINERLALIYEPAFLHTYLITREGKTKIDFKSFMESKGVTLIGVSNIEQQNWGTSFVPINANTIVHYDFSLSKKTQNILKDYGIEIIKFHPNALLAGGGSLRCLTLRLYRES